MPKIALGLPVLGITGGGGPWLEGWYYRRAISLDHNDVTGDLTNFPVLISFTDAGLAHTSSGGHVAQSTGADIAFTSDDGMTQLPHELERYEHTTGELIAWVLVPSLSSTQDTTIYIYYGNAACGCQEQHDLVWDADHIWVGHHIEDDSVSATTKDTTSYEEFGVLYQTGPDTFLWVGRQGADHVGNDGKIVKISFSPTTLTWGTFADVYDDPTYDCRNVAGGKIGGVLYAFFGRFNDAASTWIDMNYVKSEDGGASWGNRVQVTIDAALTTFSFYGALIKVGNRYYQPYYGYDGVSTYKIKALYSDDDGATWNDGPTIYSGASQYVECSVANLGGGALLAIARDNAGGAMRQFKSSDGGATWNDDGDTNMGTAGDAALPWLLCEGRRLACWFTDRATDALRVSIATKDTVWGAPAGWLGNASFITGLAGLSGYQSVLRWKGDRYLGVVSDEASSTDSDLIAFFQPDRVLWNSGRNCLPGTLSGAGGFPDRVTGKIGFGTEFFQTGWIQVSGSLAAYSAIQNTGIFTIEAWLKLDNYTADACQAIGGNTASSAEKGFFLAYENRSGTGTHELRMFVAKGQSGVPVIDSRSPDNIIGDNVFHHIVVTGDGTNVVFWVDGVSSAGDGTMGSKSSGDSTDATLLGATDYSSPGLKLDGKLDEVRISDVKRADDWIKTSYANQNNPAGFITVGTEETP